MTTSPREVDSTMSKSKMSNGQMAFPHGVPDGQTVTNVQAVHEDRTAKRLSNVQAAVDRSADVQMSRRGQVIMDTAEAVQWGALVSTLWVILSSVLSSGPLAIGHWLVASVLFVAGGVLAYVMSNRR